MGESSKRHLQIITKEKNWSNKWSMALPLVQRILNSSVSSSTGFAPDVILFGNNVDLNRGIIIHSKVASERLIECPKYKVQD
jgi:hypothetical protein